MECTSSLLDVRQLYSFFYTQTFSFCLPLQCRFLYYSIVTNFSTLAGDKCISYRKNGGVARRSYGLGSYTHFMNPMGILCKNSVFEQVKNISKCGPLVQKSCSLLRFYFVTKVRLQCTFFIKKRIASHIFFSHFLIVM